MSLLDDREQLEAMAAQIAAGLVQNPSYFKNVAKHGPPIHVLDKERIAKDAVKIAQLICEEAVSDA